MAISNGDFAAGARKARWFGAGLLVALCCACGNREQTLERDGPEPEPERVAQLAQPLLVWAERQRLAASDGTEAGFGGTIVIEGDTAVIGAAADENFAGTAYVFTRAGGVWEEQQKLQPSDVILDELFGSAVALEGDTLLIGAGQKHAEPSPGTPFLGAVYVYSLEGDTWTEVDKLVAADPVPWHAFGGALALEGDTALIAAAGDPAGGAVYVYERNGSSWQATQKITGPEGSVAFGGEVALEGGTAVILDQAYDAYNGAAYVFERQDGSWEQTQQLLGPEPGPDQLFGTSLAMTEDTFIVTALEMNGDGTASVYVRGATWTLQDILVVSDAALNDNFGAGVGLDGDVAVVSSSLAPAAYVFERSGSNWTETQKLVSDTSGFGFAIDVQDDTIMVGNASEDGGAVYVYVQALTLGSECSSDGQCHSGYCIEGVCCDSACDSGCQSCLAAHKASGEDGECGAVEEGSDPHDACAAASCASESSAIPESFCDGAGACIDPAEVPCAANEQCVAGACIALCSSDQDCTNGGTCTTEGICVLPNGATCAADGECGSGFCIDDYCCNAACQGNCESCAAAGSQGVCTNVTTARNADDKACKKATAPCKRDDDCADGSRCFDDGTCAPGPTCSADRTHAIAENQELTECTPFECEDGACLSTCHDSSDCTRGHRCNPKTSACEPVGNDGNNGGNGNNGGSGNNGNGDSSPVDDDDDGGGCTMARGARTSMVPLGLAAVLAVAAAGRRRRRR
jgi:hypothetical protein